MRKCAAVLMIGSLVYGGSAMAMFYTYAQWDRLSPSDRAYYVAGAFDSLVSFSISPSEAKVGLHYHSCVAKAQLNNNQLAENVRAFAASRPRLHGAAVQGALVQYLIELCGAPPAP